jgi:hypothetical protein
MCCQSIRNATLGSLLSGKDCELGWEFSLDIAEIFRCDTFCPDLRQFPWRSELLFPGWTLFPRK